MQNTQKQLQPLMSGILSWSSQERVSNRYGSIFLDTCDYNSTANEDTWENKELIQNLEGKRIKLVARVENTRTSGHIGDMALSITPSTPNIGDEFVVGIGIVHFKYDESNNTTSVSIIPEDNREELWFDPRTLYQLHDQSIVLLAVESREPALPVPNLHGIAGVYTIDTENNFQLKKRDITGKILAPNMEDLGDGLFILKPTKLQPGRIPDSKFIGGR